MVFRKILASKSHHSRHHHHLPTVIILALSGKSTVIHSFQTLPDPMKQNIYRHFGVVPIREVESVID